MSGCPFKLNRSVELTFKRSICAVSLHQKLKPLRISPVSAYLLLLRYLVTVRRAVMAN